MDALYRFCTPALFLIKPETAHALTLWAMRLGMIPPVRVTPDPAMETTVWGLRFPSPIGLAAGFDKNAEVIGPAFRLGFGFVEAGTVTPRAQIGNASPRIFRDPPGRAVINRMGFPNAGMSVFKANLSAFLAQRPKPPGVVGINIGMNKDQREPARDYATLIHSLAPLSDYLVINVSSPNTPGLRDLQRREFLLELLQTLRAEREKACGAHQPPLLVKLAPDLTAAQQEEIAQTLIEGRADGIVLTNTTLSRPDGLSPAFAAEKGGLSGRPLRALSTEVIRNFYHLTGGKLPIIGVGGVECADSAYEKIKAGASLVQLYSGLVYQGPGVARSIYNGLLERLRRDGFLNIAQAVGSEVQG